MKLPQRLVLSLLPPTRRTIPNLRYHSSLSTSRGCSHCHQPLSVPSPFCPSCQSPVSPPPPTDMDYPLLFSVPKTYFLTPEALSHLKHEYRRLQGLVHPDKAVGSETWAREWSARVNEGLRTLEDDFRRAEWMLSREGIHVTETDQLDDPDFLISILETRELLESATAQEEVDERRAENRADMEETIESLRTAIDGQPQDLVRAKELLIRLRYLRNVEDVCREWQPGKGIVLQH